MTRRTRRFLVGSAFIVVVGLCTGLVAYYNGALPMIGAGPGPAELSYIPETASVVAFANVGEIMKSDLHKHLESLLPADHSGQGRDELHSELGLDLEKDIDTVVAGFGVTGADQGDQAPTADAARAAAGRTVVLISGRFDRPRIESVLKEHGGTPEDYKGTQIFKEDTQAMNGQGAVAFVEPNVIALGSLDAVRMAIDTRQNGKSVRKNADVMKFVAGVDPTTNAWVTGRVDAVTKNANLPAEAKTRLAAVQWFSVAARVDGGVSGVVRAEARDDQSGEDLRSVVRGGLAAARLMGGQNAKLDIALNSLQVSGAGKDVALTFNVPSDVIDVANGIAGLKNLSGKH
jgi:hypothetical protein